MGRNLTNLYISQSFQFLTQISGSELQTGLGDTITGSLLITASRADNATSASFAATATSASFALTATSASFASTATSSSFASTATSASQAVSASFAITASYALNAGATVSTASLLTTASATANVITFTKGDGSTFPVTVATGSAVSASYATTASLALNNVVTSSTNNATITFTKGDGTTYTNVINNVVNATSASIAVSASAAVSASRATSAATADTATTASYVLNAVSASYAVSASQAQTAISSSYAISASQAQTAVSASFATSASVAVTASFATNFTASNILVTGLATIASASISNLTVIYETASVIYSSGSNQFGDASNDTQTLYGVVDVKTGPLIVTGSTTSTQGFTGSLAGTASYANNALSSSYAVSASQAQNAISSSYAVTASFALNTNLSTGSLLTTASATGNVVTFTKGDGSTFPVTVDTGSGGTAFPFTGSAQITGSLGITGSMILGIQQNATLNPNGIIAGNNNLINGPSNVGFVFAGNSVMNQFCDYAGIFGGIGHRAQFGYSQVFGGLYNYLGYNAPGAIGDVYGAAIVAGSENTVNGNRTNNMLTVGGSGNQIYTTNAAADFDNNAIILGGRFNYISGSNNMLSAIVAGRNNLIGSNVSRSVILGGNAITASVSDTVYVPNFDISGSVTGSGAVNFVLNTKDTYTSSPKVQQIITLTQAEYNAIGSPDANTLYIISGSVPFNPANFATTGSNTFVGNQVISGSLTVTGSLIANGAVTINNTASADVWLVDTKPFAQLSTDTIVAGRIDGADEDFILAGRNFNGTVPSITMTDGQFIYNESAHIFTGSVSLDSTLNVTGTTTLRDDVTITGSLRGNVGALSISSQTASLDCSTGNFFTLTLVSGSNTFVNPSNIQPGQTINLRVKQASVASGSISFASSVKQVSGSLYTPTTTANAEDIVTFIAFDSTNLYLSNVKNFV
jgi:hypothetical protein